MNVIDFFKTKTISAYFFQDDSFLMDQRESERKDVLEKVL